MITVVLTSCGRVELLKRTIDSFNKFNTYLITDFIIVDDSGSSEVHQEIKKYYSDYNLILEPKNRGQVICIDDAYSRVKTPYIFHCEDDWEFYKSDFIRPSLMILESNPIIMQVFIHYLPSWPIELEVYSIKDIQYRLYGEAQGWHGMSWNPGLRRLSDYKLISPFSSFIQEGDFNALTESRIGQAFFNRFNFRTAVLLDSFVKHIG